MVHKNRKMEDKITVYHNPRCSKSRCAIEYFGEKKIEFSTIEYLKNPPSKEEIIELLKKLGMKAEELIRKGEADFKENFKGKNFSEDEWIDAMVKFPKLIERPIIVLGDKAIIARPLERINELYTQN